MKSIFAAALLLLPLAVHAEVSSDTFCFGSGGDRSANFEMRTYFDSSSGFSSGFVKYQNSKELIPLVLASSIDETLDKSAPDQGTSTWLEVFHGQVTGEYEMISQGTEVSSMVYTSKKKNQKTGFVLNPDAIVKGGCKW